MGAVPFPPASPLRCGGPRRWIRVVAAIPALLLLLAAVALAQQRPVFEASVGRVRVDVIVTRNDGAFVDDLALSEFVLYEDGQPQRLLSAQLVDLDAGRVSRLSLEAAAPGAAGDAAMADVAERVGVATADADTTDLAAVVYLVDGLSLSLASKLRFIEAWEGMLVEPGRLPVPHALYMINGVGQLEEITPLTRDVGALRSGSERLRAVPLLNRPMPQRLVDFYNLISAMRAAGGEGYDPVEAQLQARAEEEQELTRSLHNLHVITAFCNALGARPGRKALVWVTAGVKAMVGGPFTVIAGPDTGSSPAIRREGVWDFRLGIPDSRVRAQHEELVAAANSTNVSIYAVDPSAGSDLRNFGSDASVRSAAGGAGGLFNSDEMVLAIEGTRQELRSAAAETGGEAFIAWGDLQQALLRVEQDTLRFYLLTYEPPPPVADGQYHDIRVEVRRPGVRVRARSGYVGDATGARLERLAAAALALPGTVDDLPLQAEAFRLWGREEQTTVVLAAALDATAIRTGVGSDGNLGASLSIHVRILDGDGEVVGEADDELTAVAKDNRDAARASGPRGTISYRRGWTLEPGQYDVRVAILDEISGRAGATSLEIEVPAEDDDWRTSDVMLVAAQPDAAPSPLVGGAAAAGQPVGAYLEVRRGNEPTLSATILAHAATSEAEQAEPIPLRALPLVPLRAEGADLHAATVWLPADLPPGQYLLRFEIEDAPAGRRATLEVPLQLTARER